MPKSLIKWIYTYLGGRKLAVRIKDLVSYFFDLPNSISQGSHLAPLLFIIFINNLVEVINSAKIYINMDDNKLKFL